MRKISLFSIALMGTIAWSNHANAQLTETQTVNVSLDLQPVFQLDIVGNDAVDFVFDHMTRYKNGITKTNATHLRVSSTVEWDLSVYPNTGTLTDADATNGAGNVAWDNQITYGTAASGNMTNAIPSSALQIMVTPESGTVAGTNNFASFQSLTDDAALAANDCSTPSTTTYGTCIAGNATTQNSVGVTNMAEPAGDYHYPGATPYEFRVSYKIKPGLPIRFETVGCTAAGSPTALADPFYAGPGYYTMDVQYVLSQD